MQLSWGGALGLWVIWIGLSAAVAQGNLGQVWSGRGQILSGQGQGATVDLVLEMREGRLLTQSGPRLNVPYSGGATTINNPEGLWQIEPQGERLSVTLQRGDQLIRYQLFPNRPLLQQAPLQRRLAPAAPPPPTQTGSSASDPPPRRSLGDGSIIRGILGN